MTVTIHNVPKSNLKAAEVEAWRPVPVAIAVDLARNGGQIDPAIRPLKPPGQQQSLFGRAVTALCEPPDFGAVIHALDLVGQGEVLVIAAAGLAGLALGLWPTVDAFLAGRKFTRFEPTMRPAEREARWREWHRAVSATLAWARG